jgi:hypothetical protein
MKINELKKTSRYPVVSDEDLIANGFSREDGEAIIRAAYDPSQWSEAMTGEEFECEMKEFMRNHGIKN